MRDVPDGFSQAVLDWYDLHARVLPWRRPPHAATRPDPYHVWLSEVMLQQTTVAAVEGYFRRFITLWSGIHALAAAPDAAVMAAWAGLGYYARARNLLKCARVVAATGGFPETEAALRHLPGIGPYTAAAIAAIAFDQPSVVLDGNIERVMARYFAVTRALPAAKPLLRTHAAALTPKHRPGDYVQALMDLGATVCTPRNPSCGRCPVNAACMGRDRGIAARLPARDAKPAKPVRHGQVWLALRPDGALLTEIRPASGLLGGMLALPTSGWDGSKIFGPPCAGNWQSIGEVRHTFTHFHLRLEVLTAMVPKRSAGTYIAPAALDPAAFPSLMRKVLRLALLAHNT